MKLVWYWFNWVYSLICSTSLCLSSLSKVIVCMVNSIIWNSRRPQVKLIINLLQPISSTLLCTSPGNNPDIAWLSRLYVSSPLVLLTLICISLLFCLWTWVSWWVTTRFWKSKTSKIIIDFLKTIATDIAISCKFALTFALTIDTGQIVRALRRFFTW